VNEACQRHERFKDALKDSFFYVDIIAQRLRAEGFEPTDIMDREEIRQHPPDFARAADWFNPQPDLVVNGIGIEVRSLRIPLAPCPVDPIHIGEANKLAKQYRAGCFPDLFVLVSQQDLSTLCLVGEAVRRPAAHRKIGFDGVRNFNVEWVAVPRGMFLQWDEAIRWLDEQTTGTRRTT
jgi:hypothetical protein